MIKICKAQQKTVKARQASIKKIWQIFWQKIRSFAAMVYVLRLTQNPLINIMNDGINNRNKRIKNRWNDT
jgi:hypothetical protein